MRGNPTERFWAAVDKSGECWTWTGYRLHNRHGRMTYGLFWTGEKLATAHRHSWEMTNGPIPAGAMVLHRCDNQPCVRPEHLYLGDHRRNMDDAVERGAMRRGSTQHSSRLTVESVRTIRRRLAAGEEVADIARAFGVTYTAIYYIKTGRNWRWLDAA